MKFTATGKVNDSQSAVNVVVAFFNNFNPESYIGIKDGKIDLEIVFEEEKLPIEIAESLNAVEKLEFTYGQHSLKESDSETEIVEENEITETPEVPEAPEPPETEVANEEQMVTEEIQIPEKRNIEKEVHTLDSVLDELAISSNTFEDFVSKIGEYIKVGKRKQFFENAVYIALEGTCKTWTSIYTIFEKKGISYGTWESAQLNSKIFKKFGDLCKISSIDFINKIAEYKANFFQKGESTANSQEAKVEEAESIVKMEHMPEISEFEEKLSRIDRTNSADEQVEYVLSLMGWRKDGNLLNDNIAKISKKSVEMKETDITNVISHTNICTPDLFTLRMQYARFINEFCQKFYPDINVRTSDFLADLIKLIK